MKYDYLNSVEKRLKNNRINKQILAEIEGHIDDKTEYYTELGYSPEEAEKRAVEEMGDSDDTALPFTKLYGNSKVSWFTVFCYIFLTAAVAAPFFFEKFNYAGAYFREVYHLISADIVSMAVIAGYMAVLIFAFKVKDKFLSGSVAVALIFSNFSGMAIFRPAVYSVIKIILSGFNGYIDSIFAYAYFTDNLKTPLTVGSYIVFFILLIWSLIQWAAIFRQERLLNAKKLYAFIRFVRKATAVLICLNLTVITAATVFAAFRIPEKREQLHNERVKMIDEIINTPLSSLTSSHFKSEGYKFYGVVPPLGEYRKEYHSYNYLADQYVYYNSVGNNAVVVVPSSAFYVRTDYDLPFDVLESYHIDANLLKNNKSDNLQAFIEEGWYIKAYQVLKSYGEGEQSISFSFYTNEYQTGTITFTTVEKDFSDLSKFNIRRVDYINDLYGGI